jgi:predicted outer membrane repeat protein
VSQAQLQPRPTFHRTLLSASLAAAVTLPTTVCASATSDSAFRALADEWYPGRADVRVPETRDLRLRLHELDLPVLSSPKPLVACNETSLRIALANAVSGDTIDLSACVASVITLTQGALYINADDVTLLGPGADQLTIDGGAGTGHNNKVFDHTGHGTLWIVGLAIDDAHYIGQTTANGGCIYSLGSVRLSQSTVSDCTVESSSTSNAYALGGAIYANGNVTLESSVISSNVAISAHNGAYGGGVFARGNFMGTYATIANNLAIAPTAYSYGGGVAVVGNGNFTLTNSTLFGNAARIGGALGIETTGTSMVLSSTISQNAASLYVGGAAFGHDVSITSSTITANIASYSVFGLGVQAFGTLTAESSIIADNANTNGMFDVSAQSIDGYGNLILVASAPLPADTQTACPRLSPLRDNGGVTLTQMPSSGSPVIDWGYDMGLTSDQRGIGFARVSGNWADIGAIEWQGTSDDKIFRSAFEVRCDAY